MNLTAKEFVCARHDERGVLMLSEFAGAAQQLKTAVLVNPYAIDETAAALARACTMSDAEQGGRMRLLRANVRAFDARWWAARLLADARTVRQAAAAIPAPLPLTGGGVNANLAFM
jgi:trehalose 6-phosphate synthase